MRVSLSWKQLIPPPEATNEDDERWLRVDEVGLAYFLYSVYRHMFQHEDLALMFKDIDMLKI
jgi:hypothetical protein